ncbi:MAG: VanZ family protein [Alphaproteobacteria bacterium]|nr:VanZ family protein [Alphaproteobacteria bacterium]MBV8406066.1 VanZ family protein [Alphaproteobacteria bacterium]
MSLVPFLRVAFIFCIVALCVLAWLPGDELMRTPLGMGRSSLSHLVGHAEHVLAYLGTTIVMGLALRGRVRLGVQCILLASYAAILEVGQIYSPGRHASVADLAFSAVGIAFGGLLLWIMPTLYQVWGKKVQALQRDNRPAG